MATPDTEVERWLRDVVPSSPFVGKVYVVGGYVRDRELGIDSQDLDVVVEEHGGAERFARWLHARFPDHISRPHALGAGYPIWQIVFKAGLPGGFETEGAELEIADTQAESFPDPATRQRVTVYGDVEADCRRRDFTVNMLYRDLTTGELRDPSGEGLADLRAGRLRGHPKVDLAKIFSDDPLRMLRLARFHARFGWSVSEEVVGKMRASAPRVAILSAERVRDELTKTMLTGKFPLALELWRQGGVLETLLPELMPMIGSGQDRIYHAEGDVWTHTMLVVSNAPTTLTLQLAALLHDVGKPATREEVGERVKFLGHEKVSVGISRGLLERLKFDRCTTERVLRLVELHLRGGDVTQWTSLKPARKLIREADDLLEELLQLIEADSRSSLGPDGRPRLEHIPLLREKLAEAARVPVRKRPVLDGREIMALFGEGPGTWIKRAQEALVEAADEAAERGEELSKEEAARRLKAQRTAIFGAGSD